jgi:hypothetical protein
MSRCVSSTAVLPRPLQWLAANLTQQAKVTKKRD